jgi:hypothetical protein
MLEALSILVMGVAIFKRGSQIGTILALGGLALAVWCLKEMPAAIPGAVFATLITVSFWVAQSIRITISSTQTLAALVGVMGFLAFAFHDHIPFPESGSDANIWRIMKLDPATIENLQSSHERALEIYFDHEPKEEERYFKIGTLAHTSNGMAYSVGKPALLNAHEFPMTKEWAQNHLNQNDFQENINILKKAWSGFEYTVSPGKLGSSPLDEFLFKKKAGFCQHFAAALATLLQIQGFKARVAYGFSGGTYHRFTRQLVYEMSDAHAWTEVFDARESKWISIDPTLWINSAGGDIRSRFDESIFIVFAILLGLMLPLVLQGSDRKTSLLKTLRRWERRQGLDSRGLTILERVNRLAEKVPKRKKELIDRVSDYQRAYFRRDQH